MWEPPCAALKDISSIQGITRILTSGHATPRVYEPASLERLVALAKAAPARALSDSPRKEGCNDIGDVELRIVPGSGISQHTISRVFDVLGELVDEYHMSGGSWVDGRTRVEGGEEFQMGPQGHDRSVWKTDADQVRGVLQALAKMQ